MAESRLTAHDRLCALRNLGVPACFVGFCAIEVLASWHALSHSAPPNAGVLLISFQLYALFIELCFFVGFRCVRERIVLIIAILTSVRGLIFSAVRSLRVFFAPSESISLVFWMFAFVVSASMLFSALRTRRTAAPGKLS